MIFSYRKELIKFFNEDRFQKLISGVKINGLRFSSSKAFITLKLFFKKKLSRSNEKKRVFFNAQKSNDGALLMVTSKKSSSLTYKSLVLIQSKGLFF